MNPNQTEILKYIMDFKQQGTRVLMSGLLVKIIIGVFFAWPILQSYHEILIGYKDLNHQYILYISYPLMILNMNLFIPHIDFFLKKLESQTLICLFVCLIGGSFMLIAIFDQNWILHVLLQLFIIAPSVGILYSTPFLTTRRYFIKQKQHLNSMFQIFIGLGAFFALQIFESNQANQLQLYFDNQEYFCGECFNLQTRQSLRSLTIWIFILGIVAAILVKQPDGDRDVIDSIVNCDLLAFAHLDFKQQQHNIQSSDDSDQQFDQPNTFTQSLSTKPFQIMSILVVSSSLLPYLIFQFVFLFGNYELSFEIQQEKLKDFKYQVLWNNYIRNQTTISENSISFRCKLYLIRYYFFNINLTIWIYEIGLQLLHIRLAIQPRNQKIRLDKYALNSGIYYVTLVSQHFINQHFVLNLSSLFSHVILSYNSIPKIFGPLARQGVFSFMFALMGLSAVISNSVSYFFSQETIKNMLFYFSIIAFLGQMFLYRVSK